MIITVDNRSDEELVTALYHDLAVFVLQEEGAADTVELAISLVTSEEIHELNKTYRGIDAPTDVLSFENDDELLGDVLICPVVAREHARDFNSSFEAEMELMLTHGILHLLGYDHIDDAEGDAMEARENALLAAWRAQ